MKYILTFTFFILSISTLHSQVYATQLFQNWIRVGHNDPYNGKTISIIDTAIAKTRYRFTNDGDLVIISNSNTRSEKWKWNSDSTKIGTSVQNEPITEYRMYIFKLTNDSLIIGQQGRHGIVRDYFISRQD